MVALLLAAALAIGALAISIGEPADSAMPTAMLGLFAVAILLSIVFEARYRGRKTAAGGHWQATGERELDHETGTLIEVWFDPVSGERRYVQVQHALD